MWTVDTGRRGTTYGGDTPVAFDPAGGTLATSLNGGFVVQWTLR